MTPMELTPRMLEIDDTSSSSEVSTKSCGWNEQH